MWVGWLDAGPPLWEVSSRAGCLMRLGVVDGDAAAVWLEFQFSAGVLLVAAVEHALDEVQVRVADNVFVVVDEGVEGTAAQLDAAIVSGPRLVATAVQKGNQGSALARAGLLAGVVSGLVDGLLHGTCGVAVHRGNKKTCQ